VFRNRHIVIAMLVAPLLAVLAWFSVGLLVSEKPLPARGGSSYPLVEQSSCRWASGSCELENGDLQLSLRIGEAVGLSLRLHSSHALDGVQLAFAAPGANPLPRSMSRADDTGREWSLSVDELPSKEQRIRLVVSRSGSAFFADASTAFLWPES
jgi:hypothetical protein